MKYVKYIILFALSLFFLTPYVTHAEEVERGWEDEIIYFIMIDRFHNGNPENDFDVNVDDPFAYHGGDFKGIIEKLDYIKEMGFTAIWLTPVVQNEEKGYHGYWTEDFYNTEEHFGTLEEFKQLVQEAHKRDIKIILDVVVNHTGYQHPWLKDPEKADWFHEDRPILNWNNQEEVEYGRLSGLPDLAQENPKVKDYLIEMAKWWIEETDVDGFRLDTVKHVPKWFWEEFVKEVKSVKEDFFLIGEVWHNDAQYVASYAETGIDSFVDYPFYNIGTAIFNAPNQSIGKMHAVWKRNEVLYENPYVLGNFLDNHDNPRFSRLALERGEDPVTRWKMGLAYMYTAPGIPIVYYGTEIAMDGGNDPDNRRMMEFVDHELVDYISKLAEIRHEYPSLRRGEFEFLVDDGGLALYKRTYGEETIVVVINNTTEDKTVSLATEDVEFEGQLRPLLQEGQPIKPGKDSYTLSIGKEMAEIYVLEEKSSINAIYISIAIGALGIIGFASFLVIRKNKGKKVQ